MILGLPTTGVLPPAAGVVRVGPRSGSNKPVRTSVHCPTAHLLPAAPPARSNWPGESTPHIEISKYFEILFDLFLAPLPALISLLSASPTLGGARLGVAANGAPTRDAAPVPPISP